MASWTPEDPTSPETKIGPLSSESAAEELDDLVEDAVSRGAEVLLSGGRTDQGGAFYRPTLLGGVTPEMRAYSEELFGPAGVVYRFEAIEDAIELANDSPYGLSSSVFTSNEEKAQQIAESLETGMVWINSTSKSAPDLPFGGVKRSGFGRELARYGFNEFANKKLVRNPKEK